MIFCQWESAQFSLLNRACTGLLTRLGSPWASATVDSTGLPEAGADGDGLADGEALADGDADADGLGDGESFAPIRLAPRAWVCPLEVGDALAFFLPVPLALGEGDGVGVAGVVACGMLVFDA